jgi:hypothetical protein
LFSIRLHFVRKERIAIAQIRTSQFLTMRLLRACVMSLHASAPINQSFAPAP